jgi:hypothetical protein
MTTRSRHLSEDQLIRLVVDSSHLPDDLQSHLAGCSHCQDRRQALVQKLERLAATARAYAPQPPRNIRMDAKAAPTPFYLVLAVSLALAVITIGLWQIMPDRESNRDLLTQTSAEALLTQPFLSDWPAESENGLAGFYQTLAGETGGYFDDDFMEYVHPVNIYANSV